MIVIIDYGLGNINAFINIYKKLDVPIRIAKSVEDLKEATKIILPGVGAFDHAMAKLNESGMRQKLDELVLEQHIPVIGICVGMQILANSSDEGVLPGLGWINGTVKKFDETKILHSTHLPHMGWNDVKPLQSDDLFTTIIEEPIFYFLHSYYFHCIDPANTIGVSDYGGGVFSCAVKANNIYGVQFHPEKSHNFGVQLLKNFAYLA